MKGAGWGLLGEEEVLGGNRLQASEPTDVASVALLAHLYAPPLENSDENLASHTTQLLGSAQQLNINLKAIRRNQIIT